MKIKLLLFLLFLSCQSLYSQQYLFGKVSTEFASEISGVTVVNMRTDEKVLSDKDGFFMIAAKPTDEIRLEKIGYERFSVRLTTASFSAPLTVHLEKSAFLIPEVELAIRPTGNLKKDVKALNPPRRVTALNTSMSAYMLRPPTEVAPRLSTPSAFGGPNFSAGQVNVLGLIGAAVNLISKAKNPPPATANYAETQAFYREIKQKVDLAFYTSKGWSEEDIDRFLIYADQTYSLAKTYRKNFDVAAISAHMKLAYKTYIKTHKVGS